MRDLEVPDRVLIGGDSTPDGNKAVQALVKIYSHGFKMKYSEYQSWSSELSNNSYRFFSSKNFINNSIRAKRQELILKKFQKQLKSILESGNSFFGKTSVGFGGSCFQKDI